MGLEPTTPSSVNWYSVQLSYADDMYIKHAGDFEFTRSSIIRLSIGDGTRTHNQHVMDNDSSMDSEVNSVPVYRSSRSIYMLV